MQALRKYILIRVDSFFDKRRCHQVFVLFWWAGLNANEWLSSVAYWGVQKKGVDQLGKGAVRISLQCVILAIPSGFALWLGYWISSQKLVSEISPQKSGLRASGKLTTHNEVLGINHQTYDLPVCPCPAHTSYSWFGIYRVSCCMQTWWRHQMEPFSALLAICAGNSPVPGEFSAQRPVTRSFDVSFDLRLNQHLSKQWTRWWFDTPSRSLWRHCNERRVPCCRGAACDEHGFLEFLVPYAFCVKEMFDDSTILYS